MDQKGQRVCVGWVPLAAEGWTKGRGVDGHQCGEFDICGRLVGGQQCQRPCQANSSIEKVFLLFCRCRRAQRVHFHGHLQGLDVLERREEK